MYIKGKHNFVPLPGRGHVAQGAWEDTIVTADDIPKYCNQEFFEALWLWNRTKTWGWAHAKGWADEPADYVLAVMAIEDAVKVVESEMNPAPTVNEGFTTV